MKNIIISIIVTLFVTICTDSHASCSDQKTINAVNKIYEQGLLSLYPDNIRYINAVSDNYIIKVKDIQTLVYDNTTGKYTCEAVIEVTFSDKIKTKFPACNKVITETVTYTSQETADTKQPYVRSISDLRQFIWSTKKCAAEIYANEKLQMRRTEDDNKK
jgi:predicted transcriptional regulator